MTRSLSTAADCSSSSVCNSAYVCAVPIAAGDKCQGSGQGTSTYLNIHALFDCCFSLHNELKHWLWSLQ